jgi:pimeloyl-ACP methyl ester carboxylesterase
VLSFWLGLGVLLLPLLLAVSGLILLHLYLRFAYMHKLGRIFREKPLFIIPRGQPIPGAEEVLFPTPDGLTLHGCYLKARAPRRGVVLFGLEFGSNRWSCVPYCEHLLDEGYDVFAFESRGQGDSPCPPGYEPLQWVTDHEVRDTEAALAYLKARPDADPRGVGLFGISKGGGAGLQVAARDPWVRCFVTDGVFATCTTVVPYVRLWLRIYSRRYVCQMLAPSWLFGWHALISLGWIEREQGYRFVHLEPALRRLAPRPWLLIHGGADTYIKPDMARRLFALARRPKELWIVPGAKHNQALQLVSDEYRRRVAEFFNTHLATPAPTPEPTRRDAPRPSRGPHVQLSVRKY